jgi:hypothetical protein
MAPPRSIKNKIALVLSFDQQLGPNPSATRPAAVTDASRPRNARHNIQQSRGRTVLSMITTLRLNMKDPYRRKAFGAKLGGKMIGLALLVARR